MRRSSARGWAAAQTEHELAIADFRARLHRISAGRWMLPSAGGKWSPAEETLHVVLAYELGLAAVAGGPGMQLRVSPARAALYRWIVLPLVLRRGSFPRGAEAPQELLPSAMEAADLSAQALSARLQNAASEIASALRAAEQRRPAVRVVHAYFGPLQPLTTLRLLSLHTRHHARLLSNRAPGTGAGDDMTAR